MNSPALTGAALGLAAGGGVAMAVGAWWRTRRPALQDRVLPYVRDVVPLSSSVVPRPDLRQRAGEWLGELMGGSDSVLRRLDRCAAGQSLEQFRAAQLRWAGGGFALTLALSLVLWAQRETHAVTLALFCLAGTVGGALACDQHLSSRVAARERNMAEEFPTIADLLALSVAAGESPATALRRVTEVAHGDLSDEFDRVLGEVHTGATLAEAFDALAARTGVTSVARFAEGLAVSVERGTPLVDVLHAQAADVRASARRDLMESGGRRETFMMVPVVFLILPVTLVFAFYPGLIGLHLTSGS